MNVEQMIYTSCRRGIGSGAGFQTQATSSGLSLEDRTELEQLQAYKSPRCLPATPTPEDVQRICPPNYQFTELSSGCTAVTRSVYVGLDYSGRSGNFLAHSLVFPAAATIWPIDVSLWKGWRSSVTNDPPDLKRLSLDDLAVDSALLSYTSLSRFVSEDGRRKEQLPSMLNALLESRKTNRPLIVRDEPGQLVYWIASLTKLLPRNLSPPLRFASFVNAQLPEIDIQCTTKESDLRIATEELEYRAFAFDFIDGRFSAVESAEDSCGHILASRLIRTPEWFLNYHAFTGAFRFEANADRIQLLLTCLAMVEGGRTSGQSEQRVSDALVFAGESLAHSKSGMALLDTLVGRSVAGAVTTDTRISLSEGLCSLSVDSSQAESKRMAIRALVRLIHNELTDGTSSWEHLLAVLDRAVQQAHFPRPEVESMLLSADTLIEIAKQHQASGNHISQLLRFLALRAGGVDESSSHRGAFQDTVDRLILATSHASIVGPLLAVTAESGGPKEFCALCIELTRSQDKHTTSAVGNGMAKALDGPLASHTSEVRQSLVREGELPALLLELQYRAENVNANPLGFLECLATLRAAVGRRKQAEFHPYIVSAWQNASQASRNTIAEWLFAHTDIIMEIDRVVSQEMICDMAATIPLDRFDRRTASLDSQLHKLCKKTKCQVPLHLPLRSFLQKVSTRRFRSLGDVHAEWNSLRPQLDHPTGQTIVAQALLPLLSLADTPDNHSWVLDWACDVATAEFVGEQYTNAFIAKEYTRISPEAAAACVVAVLSADRHKPPLNRILKQADSRLDEWLCSLSDKCFSGLGGCVKSNTGLLSKEKEKEWSTRIAAITRKRRSLLGSILRMVGLRSIW